MEKVISRDGTQIAVDKLGSGPALVLMRRDDLEPKSAGAHRAIDQAELDEGVGRGLSPTRSTRRWRGKRTWSSRTSWRLHWLSSSHLHPGRPQQKNWPFNVEWINHGIPH